MSNPNPTTTGKTVDEVMSEASASKPTAASAKKPPRQRKKASAGSDEVAIATTQAQKLQAATAQAEVAAAIKRGITKEAQLTTVEQRAKAEYSVRVAAVKYEAALQELEDSESSSEIFNVDFSQVFSGSPDVERLLGNGGESPVLNLLPSYEV